MAIGERRDSDKERKMTTIKIDKWGFHLSIDTKVIKEPTTYEHLGNITIKGVIEELRAAAEMLEREQKKQ